MGKKSYWMAMIDVRDPVLKFRLEASTGQFAIVEGA